MVTPRKLSASPRLVAGVFSRLFFIWLYPLFNKGRKKDLELEDIYQALPEDLAHDLGDRLTQEWDKEVEKARDKLDESRKGKLLGSSNDDPAGQSRPSLAKGLIRMFFFKWLAIGFLLFLEECVAKMLQPLCLGLLLRYFGGEFGEKEGYLFAGGVVVCTMYYTTSHHPSFFVICHLNMKVRIACSTLLYRKSLKLSQAALVKTTVGQLVNLLSNDCARFDFCLSFIHYMWIGPVQLGLIIYILWGYFGPTCLSGVFFLVLFTPFQSLMGHCFSKLRMKVAGKTDKRIRLMNEIISGIRVIKMYAFENPFAKLVGEYRVDEVKTIRSTLTLRGINLSLYYVSSKLIIFLTLVTYVLTGNFLTAESVFVAMAMYQNVRLLMTIFFPLGISNLAETKVSIQRIENFLLLEDHNEPSLSSHYANLNSTSEKSSDCFITVNQISAKWDDASNEQTLNNITFQLKRGDLLAVVGPVGSGKSSLLQIVLHELPVSSGEIKVVGTTAYASQDPWVFSSSVRDNILFGRSYDPEWYRTVIDACALKKDFTMMPHGDRTVLGDKGISLSGGQKARINLARAVYANADIYLLDDPLSAVDAEIARHLFEKCIRGLLRNKLCILNTHQIQFLPNTSEIILLNSGKAIFQGKYADFQKININISEILPETPDTAVDSLINESGERKNRRASAMSFNGSFNELTRSRQESIGSVEAELLAKEAEESSSYGTIGLSIYWKYMHAGSNLCILFLLLLSNLLTQVIYSGSDYWLQYWIREEQESRNGTELSKTIFDEWFPSMDPRLLQISIYSFLIGLLFIMTLIRTIGFFKMCMRSSIAIHRQLFYGILRAPMAFFEKNPVGRILNRFTKDIGTIDELLCFTLFDTVEVGLQVLGVIVLVTIISPIFVIPSVIVGILLFMIRNFYQKTARDLKRLEGIARSPVFSHLSTSMCGLTTIRAFHAQSRFEREFESHLDIHTAAFYLFTASTRWLGIVVDWISILYITAVTFGVVALKIDAAAAGLAISSAMSLTSWFQWGVRQSSEAENQMVSVERVLEYAELEPEAALDSIEGKKPPVTWPSNGKIEFKELYVKYGDENEPFLKNVTCLIKPLEKIGIVGRTGAGKTSLISALFRLTEPSSGTILIDNINISEIGLHDLRSKISIIPQDPVLFLGTFRKNLDPLVEYSDTEIFAVLQDVHLFNMVKELPSGLDAMINEGGSNLSVGQRQLICLGRAILRKNKILVMDEATANVDPETDALIQTTIRSKFVNCTVMTIAHRLHTVIDSDRIMVLDSGIVKEFDKPCKLLQNHAGLLYHLVQETGPEAAEKLTSAASAQN